MCGIRWGSNEEPAAVAPELRHPGPSASTGDAELGRGSWLPLGLKGSPLLLELHAAMMGSLSLSLNAKSKAGEFHGPKQYFML